MKKRPSVAEEIPEVKEKAVLSSPKKDAPSAKGERKFLRKRLLEKDFLDVRLSLSWSSQLQVALHR